MKLTTKTGILVVVALLLGGLATLPTATANGDDITLEAVEGDCGDDSFCWSVAHGSLDSLQPGATVTIEVVNPEENGAEHNLHVADLADASEGEGTDASVAFAMTGDLMPGESETITVTVPDDVDGVYLWCDIPGHEESGMYESVGGGNGDDGNGTPGFTAMAALAAIGAAFALATKRD